MKEWKIFILSDYYPLQKKNKLRKKLKRKGYKRWRKEVIVANRKAELWRATNEILDKPCPFGKISCE